MCLTQVLIFMPSAVVLLLYQTLNDVHGVVEALVGLNVQRLDFLVSSLNAMYFSWSH